jgi:putative endonuclease
MRPRPEATLDRRARGAAVEAAALAYLQDRGLRLLARNAASKVGEIDLVLRDGATVVFVEVRYRAHVGYGGGAASVDAGKRRKLVRAAQVFLMRNPTLSQSPCRFDVVDASGDPDAPDLRWIRAAFTA